MQLKVLAVVMVLGVACKDKQPPAARKTMPENGALLKKLIAELREDSWYWFEIEGEKAREIRELADHRRRPWEWLTPLEGFYLFEASEEARLYAPIPARVKSYCGAVRDVTAKLFGPPGEDHRAAAQHVIDLQTEITRCLAKLFDEKGELHYPDENGEDEVSSEANQWTVGDLAAGFVARILNEPYDANAEPTARAARRAELRTKVERTAPPR